MAEKNTKKKMAKKTKKEVVDTGAAQEFIDMMTNKPVSEIKPMETVVKPKTEKIVDTVSVIADNDKHENVNEELTVQPDDLPEIVEEAANELNSVIDTGQQTDKECCTEVSECINDVDTENIPEENSIDECEQKPRKYNYVKTAMGIRYD